MTDQRLRNIVLELIDELCRPLQQGGKGLADNSESPLMRLREKLVELPTDYD